MTDANDWELLRTAAAQKNARRFHSNKRAYTIYMDRLGADIHQDNVHWIDQPPHGRELSEPFIAVGIYLGEYHLDMDNNPDWHAVVTVDRPTVSNGDVRITGVTISGNALESTTLPLAEITRRLFDVGGVVGEFSTVRGESSGALVHWCTISVSPDGYPFHPSDIESLRGGTRERPGMYNPATYQIVIDALRDYDNQKREHTTSMTQRQYVAKRTGYSETNIQKVITAARNWAAKNNKETK
jgi:hypothetical protein